MSSAKYMETTAQPWVSNSSLALRAWDVNSGLLLHFSRTQEVILSLSGLWIRMLKETHLGIFKSSKLSVLIRGIGVWLSFARNRLLLTLFPCLFFIIPAVLSPMKQSSHCRPRACESGPEFAPTALGHPCIHTLSHFILDNNLIET